MKFLSLMSLLGLTVLGLAGCSDTGTNTTTNTTNSNARTTNMSNSTTNSNMGSNTSNMNMSNSTSSSSSTNDFMMKAAQGGMAEVELGKMASSKAQNADVKKFGQKMIDDHSKANAELKTLASKKNVTLPSDVGLHKKMMDDLSKLSGAEFDKEYVDAMVEDHEKDVAEFQKQADSGTDADVKAFASKTLPTLKMHLQMIKDIQSKMK